MSFWVSLGFCSVMTVEVKTVSFRFQPALQVSQKCELSLSIRWPFTWRKSLDGSSSCNVRKHRTGWSCPDCSWFFCPLLDLQDTSVSCAVKISRQSPEEITDPVFLDSEYVPRSNVSFCAQGETKVLVKKLIWKYTIRSLVWGLPDSLPIQVSLKIWFSTAAAQLLMTLPSQCESMASCLHSPRNELPLRICAFNV